MVDVQAYSHPGSSRPNLPTDQTERFMDEEDYSEQSFEPTPRDNTNYPTLQWNRSEQTQFEHGPLYIQEKISPAALIQSALKEQNDTQPDMFAQFNGLPEEAAYEWYRHQGNWQNRLIHGDGKRVMASLAQREGLAGQVQMVYMDPPYNIKFDANFQLKTDEIEVSENGDEMPHDPMALRAFRDSYTGNIHTFLDNLYQQLTITRELLTESGSCFLQIGPGNLHEVACLMNEVFGKENHVATIPYVTRTNNGTRMIPEIGNWILWFAKDKTQAQYKQLYEPLSREEKLEHMTWHAMCEMSDGTCRNLTGEEKENLSLLPSGSKLFNRMPLNSSTPSEGERSEPFKWNGKVYPCPPGRHWTVSQEGIHHIAENGRMVVTDKNNIAWKRYEEEIPGRHINAVWAGMAGSQDKRYIVQTPEKAIERCILMTTDPGDLVLDPTCGAGTTGYLAEKWGRRWITVDASRVAIAVARQRLTTSRFDYYLLQDSEAGTQRERELPGARPLVPTGTEDVARNFVYPRIPRVSSNCLESQ